MTTATALKPSARKQLPPPNSDFFQFADLLTAEERATVQQGARVHGVQGGADHHQILD